MSSNFVKLTVGVNKSSQQDIYVNPKLIRTVQSMPDNKSTFISLSDTKTFQIGLPIEEVLKLIDK
jgi:hypothetical protein